MQPIYALRMQDEECPRSSRVDAIERWYLASLVPRSCDLKRHLDERRSIAEALEERRLLVRALAGEASSSPSDADATEPSSRPQSTSPIHALASVARYRQESSPRESEFQRPFSGNSRMGQWHRHTRVTYWRSLIAETTEPAQYRDLYSARMNLRPDHSNAKRDTESK